MIDWSSCQSLRNLDASCYGRDTVPYLTFKGGGGNFKLKKQLKVYDLSQSEVVLILLLLPLCLSGYWLTFTHHILIFFRTSSLTSSLSYILTFPSRSSILNTQSQSKTQDCLESFQSILRIIFWLYHSSHLKNTSLSSSSVLHSGCAESLPMLPTWSKKSVFSFSFGFSPPPHTHNLSVSVSWSRFSLLSSSLSPQDRRYIIETLLNGLQRLEYRGYDSAGQFIITRSCLMDCNLLVFGCLL